MVAWGWSMWPRTWPWEARSPKSSGALSVQDPEILERFRFEARNQAQLVHTTSPWSISFLVEDEQAFLVLEFIDGETLESRINREGRIVAMEALPIFRKILGALGYAHSKG